jgi:hypothetical protein
VIAIELLGVPRLRAGRDATTVEAASLRETLTALGAACPALDPSVVRGGLLSPHYLIAKNGLQFTARLGEGEGDALGSVSALNWAQARICVIAA